MNNFKKTRSIRIINKNTFSMMQMPMKKKASIKNNPLTKNLKKSTTNTGTSNNRSKTKRTNTQKNLNFNNGKLPLRINSGTTQKKKIHTASLTKQKLINVLNPLKSIKSMSRKTEQLLPKKPNYPKKKILNLITEIK